MRNGDSSGGDNYTGAVVDDCSKINVLQGDGLPIGDARQVIPRIVRALAWTISRASIETATTTLVQPAIVLCSITHNMPANVQQHAPNL
jgi:hypothetical protein